MLTVLKDQAVSVWLLLVIITLLAWGIGLEHGFSPSSGPNVGMAIVLAIAFFKVQLVGSYFMELQTAAFPLRMAFTTWVVVVGATVIGMYLWM